MMTMAELNPAEQEIVDCYHSLVKILSDRRDDLAPFEERNTLKAVAALWQVVNGLDLDPGQLYHLGA
jgi:hypothetical protein